MEKLSKISKIFNKIYYNLFVENFKGKLHYNFPSNYFRWDLIEYFINKYGYSENDFKNATNFSKTSISLPLYPILNKKEIDYVIKTFDTIWKEYRK